MRQMCAPLINPSLNKVFRAGNFFGTNIQNGAYSSSPKPFDQSTQFNAPSSAKPRSNLLPAGAAMTPLFKGNTPFSRLVSNVPDQQFDSSVGAIMAGASSKNKTGRVIS